MDEYKVDRLEEAMRLIDRDEWFVPRLSCDNGGTYIDLDQEALQILIYYYSGQMHLID